ncbi:myosin 29 [Tribonema minus]|uniref:Myosin 29 n=1 Tax=Tribonema minus TaxID=303371 RepID=A0A836CBL7_9STRA|nr:myosin 29 [Tribonema minus]
MATKPALAKKRSSKSKTRTQPKVSVSSLRGEETQIYYWDPADCVPLAQSRAGTPDLFKDDAYIRKWLYSPATVFRTLENGDMLAKTADGEAHRLVSAATAKKVSAQDTEGVADILQLNNFSEMSLLHTLRVRYARDQVYSFVGPILISINPYRWIDQLYDEDTMLRYHGARGSGAMGRSTVDPHLFCVADAAYASLVSGGAKPVNQSIIISGESGAGKTEATKHVMRFLARIQARASQAAAAAAETNGGLAAAAGGAVAVPAKAAAAAAARREGGTSLHIGELEQRVLSCNPLLEAFGNARTLRNDNSSRFGKFIQIQFDCSGHITGAEIQNYLLEKTRVVRQAPGECTYHIFHQLCNCGDAELKEALRLGGSGSGGGGGFAYLNSAGAVAAPAEHADGANFLETRKCLSQIRIDDATQCRIFELLAAVLHLGDVAFDEASGDGGETVCRAEGGGGGALGVAAGFLGVRAADVSAALCTKQLHVGGNTVVQQQTAAQALDKRDALAKAVYSQLFLWLVARLNGTIAAPAAACWGFIGVLDIYGFEKFDTNGFEQLLINFANEKLQRHFNLHIFEVEQDEYASEGIDWSYIKFNDNQACLDLIEGKPEGKPGVLIALDDMQRFKGAEADAKFLGQLVSNFAAPAGAAASAAAAAKDSTAGAGAAAAAGGHPHFTLPRFQTKGTFGVVHYAGEVLYSCAGFNDGNSDALSADLRDLLAASASDLVREAFAIGDVLEQRAPTTPAGAGGGRGGGGGGGAARAAGRIREASVGAQFRQSLAGLMATIASTAPRYIRCIKPNHNKAPDALDAAEALRQLRYAGMMETVRIRQQGYALREDHDAFFRRYSVLLPDAATVSELVDHLCSLLRTSKDDWQLGHTKLFLRASLAERLETLVDLRVRGAARTIQRARRACLLRRAATLAQARARGGAAARRRFLRLIARAVRLQAWWRRARAAARYRATYAQVVRVQAAARGLLGRRRAADLRFPFLAMAPEKLLRTKQDAEGELAAALEAKDFAKCAELQSRLAAIDRAAAQRGITAAAAADATGGSNGQASGGAAAAAAGGTMTRGDIDVRLLETQLRLADAEAARDYVLCGQLHEAQVALQALRRQHPTAEEARAHANVARRDLDAAVARKDFSAAARLQAQADALEAEAAALAAAERGRAADDGARRAALEAEAARCRAEVGVAQEKRDFVRCAELQTQVEAAEAAIAALPTAESLAQEITEARAALDAAKAQRDHAATAQLTLRLPQLEALRKALTEAALAALSRAQLHERAEGLRADIAMALAARDFVRCAAVQEDLDAVEAAIGVLPTAAALDERIAAVDAQLHAALAAKDFVRCSELQAQLEELRAQRAELPPADTPPPPPPAEEPPLAAARAVAGAAPVPVVAAAPPAVVRAAASAAAAAQPPPVTPAPAVRVHQPANASADAAAVRRTSATARTARSVSGASAASSADRAPAAAELNTPARLAAPGRAPPSAAAAAARDHRAVSRLRPRPPTIQRSDASIAAVAAAMAGAKVDACLLVGEDGSLHGIITDNDLTRRVIAKGIDVGDSVASVMTQSPRCVAMEDSAMEALGVMIERHFRHLPVTDASGAVTGVLDIAKCLYDAITRLERVMAKQSSHSQDLKAGQGAEALKQLTMAMKQHNRKGMSSAQAATMQMLMMQMFGDEGEPSLQDVLKTAGQAMFVSPRDTVRDAATAMANGRKAVVVVERGKLVGILTPKDLLNRVLAKDRSPDDTLVSEVMTPNPDSVPADMPVLDALHQMHEQRYLHLPVVDANGRVMGLVDVMEIINATIGKEGSTAWEALFGAVIDEDDFSDTASARSAVTFGADRHATPARAPAAAAAAAADHRAVAKLRPRPPTIQRSNASIAAVAAAMAGAKVDACLLVGEDGSLHGIITDNDLTRRVIAKGIDVEDSVASVMTQSPRCVVMEDSAMEALGVMIERHFRHLPVTDASGAVTGVLDIAKCLYDAITRLERVMAKHSSHSQDLKSGQGAEALKQLTMAMKQHNRKGMSSAQAATMQMLMMQMFGDEGEPSLQDVLKSAGQAVFVSPRDTVRDAATAMADGRKAVVVVERGKLVGILTPKDLLNRVLAKDRSPDDTLVSDVMTPNPDSVPADMPVLDALHQMHEQRYLHLPVVDANGRVMGLVDVMEIINATIGKEGSTAWEALFGAVIDEDDFSDTASARSGGAGSVRSRRSANTARSGAAAAAAAAAAPRRDDRPVSRLRPRPPVTQSAAASIGAVAVAMGAAKADACLLVGEDGRLAGIVTDNDLTRRVVAKGIALSDAVSSVMTGAPRCVGAEDSAMEALGVMIERHFRHLPVTDASGAVTGVLDIAKCLYDAITRLERVMTKRGGGSSAQGAGGGAEALQQLSQAVQQHSRKGMNAAQAATMQLLMQQMFGEEGEPSLDDVLKSAGQALFVSPRDTVRDAATAMADGRKAVVVVERGKLVGIFTPKDLLNRVLAKDRLPDDTLVSEVMTPNPDSVPADMPVLDALHQMHEQRYLHLPVVDANGRVMGLVDVMEIINATIGKEGSTAWEALFGAVIDEDAFSDTASARSGANGGGGGSVRSSMRGGGGAAAAAFGHTAAAAGGRAVAALRPKRPLTMASDALLVHVAEAMAAKRADACLLVASDGALSGIVTDVDLTVRVVAGGVDPYATSAADVMTRDPRCVGAEDSAMEALGVMVERRFRHLPVRSGDGGVEGILDIASCLYDAIGRLDGLAARAARNGSGAGAADLDAFAKRGSMTAAQVAAVNAVMAQVFPSASAAAATLSDVIRAAGAPVFVSPRDSVRDAAHAIAESRKAVLVVDAGRLTGILTPKDVLFRVLAKHKSPDDTLVADIMTPSPDTVAPDTPVLDALHQMHEQRYLHLPVVDANGRVAGLVSVMEIIDATIGKEGSAAWEALFGGGGGAYADDAASERGSVRSSFTAQSPRPFSGTPAAATVRVPQQFGGGGSSVRGGGGGGDMPPPRAHVGGGGGARLFEAHDGDVSDGMSLRDNLDSLDLDVLFVYKVTDAAGNTHRVRASAEALAPLRAAVAGKLGCAADPAHVELRYTDDDGDECLLAGDDSLHEAVDMARAAGWSALRLSAAVFDTAAAAAAAPAAAAVVAPVPVPERPRVALAVPPPQAQAPPLQQQRTAGEKGVASPKPLGAATKGRKPVLPTVDEARTPPPPPPQQPQPAAAKKGGLSPAVLGGLAVVQRSIASRAARLIQRINQRGACVSVGVGAGAAVVGGGSGRRDQLTLVPRRYRRFGTTVLTPGPPPLPTPAPTAAPARPCVGVQHALQEADAPLRCLRRRAATPSVYSLCEHIWQRCVDGKDVAALAELYRRRLGDEHAMTSTIATDVAFLKRVWKKHEIYDPSGPNEYHVEIDLKATRHVYAHAVKLAE